MLDAKSVIRYYVMALLANVFVGCLPMFWALLHGISSEYILLQRCIWTCCFLVPLVIYKVPLQLLRTTWKKDLLRICLSSLFIGINWLAYVYAITHGQVLEASLAYFMAPIVTIFLGYAFLREPLFFIQKIAIGLATITFVILLVAKGVFPMIGLVVGISFSFYSFMGRKIESPPIFRMCVETFILSVLLLLFFRSPYQLVTEFIFYSHLTKFLFVVSGILTIVPFFLLNTAIKHLPLSAVGIMGFIVPSLIFLIGIFYFHEKLDQDKLYALLLIWVSVACYIAGMFQPLPTR